jgi:Arc/MetJ family transcription regulator
VHKTTIELDEELVARAAEALGTKGLKATVQRALEEAIAHQLRLEFIDQLVAMDGLDLDKSDVLDQAWR